MLSTCIKHVNHELNLWHAHQQAIVHVILIRSFSCVFFFILVVQLMICIIAFLIVFNICIEWILSKSSFFLVYARHMRSATLIFKSFIDVSLCSVDAAHMHRRGFDNQMWIYLWPRLMLLAYDMHRVWGFSILKFNPTPRIFSNPRLNFSNPLPAAPRSRSSWSGFTSLMACIGAVLMQAKWVPFRSASAALPVKDGP